MVGYIKAYKPELKMKDFETYKGIYCSLCKQLGKKYTPFAQLLLNYDFVFLLVLKLSMSESCQGIKIKHCQYNPFKKCCCIEPNDYLNESADLIVIISYYKIRDDITDKKGLKRMIALLTLPLLSLIHLKAKKHSPEFERIVANAVAEQTVSENDMLQDIDKAAQPTAKALSEIFVAGEEIKEKKEILKRLGYILGRWVYIIDALDDLDEDTKNKNFNPFSEVYSGYRAKDETEEFLKYAGQVLLTTSGEAALAFELLELKRYNNILNNIIYDGLLYSARTVLNKYRKCNYEKPV